MHWPPKQIGGFVQKLQLNDSPAKTNKVPTLTVNWAAVERGKELLTSVYISLGYADSLCVCVCVLCAIHYDVARVETNLYASLKLLFDSIWNSICFGLLFPAFGNVSSFSNNLNVWIIDRNSMRIDKKWVCIKLGNESNFTIIWLGNVEGIIA